MVAQVTQPLTGRFRNGFRPIWSHVLYHVRCTETAPGSSWEWSARGAVTGFVLHVHPTGFFSVLWLLWLEDNPSPGGGLCAHCFPNPSVISLKLEGIEVQSMCELWSVSLGHS